jgi:hypothetical protein
MAIFVSADYRTLSLSLTPVCRLLLNLRAQFVYRSALIAQRKMAPFLTLPNANEQFVHRGDTIALEGFMHLIPFAAGHEIIRQRTCDLTLVRMTPDLSYGQMIGPVSCPSS